MQLHSAVWDNNTVPAVLIPSLSFRAHARNPQLSYRLRRALHIGILRSAQDDGSNLPREPREDCPHLRRPCDMRVTGSKSQVCQIA